MTTYSEDYNELDWNKIIEDHIKRLFKHSIR